MKLTLDPDITAWVEVEARRAGTTPSEFVRSLLRERMREQQDEALDYDAAMRRFFSIQPYLDSGGRPYPSREETHRRR